MNIFKRFSKREEIFNSIDDIREDYFILNGEKIPFEDIETPIIRRLEKGASLRYGVIYFDNYKFSIHECVDMTIEGKSIFKTKKRESFLTLLQDSTIIGYMRESKIYKYIKELEEKNRINKRKESINRIKQL